MKRLLFVRRVLVDNEQTARIAEKLCHAESGLEGLKNLPRIGIPPQVSGQNFAEIKRSENLAGWRAKEVMNIISTDYYTSGASVLKCQERGLLTLHQAKKRSSSKKAKEIISYIAKDFTVAVEDESIFIHDALIRRRMWTPE